MKLNKLLFSLAFLVLFSTHAWADTEPTNNTYVGSETLALDAEASGNIGNLATDPADYYTITTPEDGTISYSVNLTGSGYVYMKIFDSDGVTELKSTLHTAPGIFVGGLDGRAAGTYYVVVQSYSAGTLSPYDLTLSVVSPVQANDTEPNNTPGTAGVIPQNGAITGHIGYRFNGGSYDIDDYYQLTTTQDGNINVTFNSSEITHYNSIYLYDGDGVTSLGSASGYGTASFTANGLAAGAYYVRMYYYSPGQYSGYTLTNTVIVDGIANDAEINDTYDVALSMAENSSVTGHIGYRINGGSYDVDDYWQFITTQDGNITLNFSSNEVSHYNTINLYDSDGTTNLGGASGYGAASVTVNGLAAGTYYARMNYYSPGQFSGYTLTNTVTPANYTNDVEFNGDLANAVLTETNTTVEGHIGYRYNGGTYDTYDYYKLTTHSSGDFSITLYNPNGAYNQVALLSSAGVVLASGYDYGGLTISKTDAAAGDYYLRVYYYSPTYYTGYTLTNNFCPDAITIIAEGETTFCDGESVTLSTEDHHLDYLWSDGSVTETNTVLLTGDYSLTIDNGAGCVRTSNTINIESTPLPVAIIDADGPTEFCAGGSVTLSVPVIADEYLWSNGATTATITVSTTGDYDVLLTKNSCSAISDPIHIEVNANPVATISADGPTTFCDGGDVTLSATAASDYLWSNGETTASIFVDMSGSYSVMITDVNGCMATSSTTEVTENANPTASISADGATTFCIGESVNLTGSGGTSYLWNTGAITATINVTSTNNYSVTVFNAEGCSDVSSTISVTAEDCGTVSISADGPTTFCNGGSVTLTSSEPTGNVWSNGETTESIVVTASGDYYVDNGLYTSSTISVTVNSNPVATITPDGSTTFCEGGDVTLTANAASSYLWSNGETSASILVEANGSFSVTITDVNGCMGTSSLVDVIVNSNPVATISADGSTTFCIGESVDLTAAGGASYLWSTGETTTTINAITTNSYSVTAYSAEGCSAVSDEVSVIANVCDMLSITADGATEFCVGGSVTLTSSEATGNIWNTGEITQSIVVATSGDYYVNNGINTSNTITVTVTETPTVSIAADGVLICYEASTLITATTDGASIQWQLNGVDIPGATDPVYFASVNGKYTAIASNGTCSATSNIIKLKYAERLPTTPAGTASLCGPSLTMSVPALLGATFQWYQNNTLIVGATSNMFTTTSIGKFYCLAVKAGCTRASKLLEINDACRLEGDAIATLNVSPNPTSETFTLDYNIIHGGTTTIMMTDIAGRSIIHEVKTLESGNYSDEFNINDLVPGIYIIIVVEQDGHPLQQKLVIEK